MRRRDRNAEPCRDEQGDRAARFRAESLHGAEPRDPRSHRMNNSPAAEERPQSHRRLTGEHHPQRHVKPALQLPLRVQERGDDSHRLLGVIAAVAQRIQRGRHKLEMSERIIHAEGRRPHKYPGDQQHEE